MNMLLFLNIFVINPSLAHPLPSSSTASFYQRELVVDPTRKTTGA